MNERTGETTIGSQAETFVQGNPSKQETALADYDDNTPLDQIELTAAERKTVLRKATAEKRARIHSRRYAKKVHAETIRREITAAQYRALLTNRMKNDYETEFIIDDENRYVVDLLCKYFASDPDFENADESYSLKKGIILWGPIGCGKTLLMKALQFNTKTAFQLVTCRSVETQFAEQGHKALEIYANKPLYPTLQGFCFDDLGTEDLAMNFGNRKDVMESIVNARYTECDAGTTHFTTNLRMKQIEEVYGKRMRSRLREMCNLIAFPSESKDRRI